MPDLADLPVSALDNARYLTVCERNADRAALLLGGDPTVVAACAKARGDGTGHLIRGIGHAAWLSTRAKLGVGVR